MDIDEHWKHSNRRQLIKMLGHLLDARRAINLAIEHSKLVGAQSDYCRAIENNIDALSTGLDETVKLCGAAADEFRTQMQDPNDRPAPIRGQLEWTPNISPFQRQLIREGALNLQDTPGHITPKIQLRAPKILPFTLKQRKPKKKRIRTKEDIPI